MKTDDLAIPLALIAVGALRVIPQLLEGGRWSAEPSVAAVALALGVLALLAEVLRPGHGGARP